ncbi:MAG: cbb3-type cytochrome c oxidase subunit 3 [Geminicoccaceae bacterium]|nr:cbb3-type cytochrome c oxidase subunit 3 [Geminicoccaceae bacterium]MCS7267050.1 cbb3-type cytochrome c oxidase subunit 3 [Geminicoccaceae bacterium]MDW8125430.1 cbb3-type cytochrome c oxidase subunit 3 [Geminicoccaceae bacterium]MDW8342248.1 cbb3-type cytochrome c oxidase subunit 3 [Geminicoccaceae bacterium]
MSTLFQVLHQFWIVWLVALFVAIVAWTFWPSRKHRLERHARIPFEDEDRPDAR